MLVDVFKVYFLNFRYFFIAKKQQLLANEAAESRGEADEAAESDRAARIPQIPEKISTSA